VSGSPTNEHRKQAMSKYDSFRGLLLDVFRLSGRGVGLCVDINGGKIRGGDQVSINGATLIVRAVAFIDRAVAGSRTEVAPVVDETLDLEYLRPMIGSKVVGTGRRKDLLDLVGEIDIDPDYDHKQARRSRFE
jgi:hypothetical protein